MTRSLLPQNPPLGAPEVSKNSNQMQSSSFASSQATGSGSPVVSVSNSAMPLPPTVQSNVSLANIATPVVQNASWNSGQSSNTPGGFINKYSVPSPIQNVTYDVYEMPPLENGTSFNSLLQGLYSQLQQNQSGANNSYPSFPVTMPTGPPPVSYQTPSQSQGLLATSVQGMYPGQQMVQHTTSQIPNNALAKSIPTSSTAKSPTSLSSTQQTGLAMAGRNITGISMQSSNFSTASKDNMANSSSRVLGSFDPNTSSNSGGQSSTTPSVTTKAAYVTTSQKVSESTQTSGSTSTSSTKRDNILGALSNVSTGSAVPTSSTTMLSKTNSSVSTTTSPSSTLTASNNSSSKTVVQGINSMVSSNRSNYTSKTGSDYGMSEPFEIKTNTPEKNPQLDKVSVANGSEKVDAEHMIKSVVLSNGNASSSTAEITTAKNPSLANNSSSEFISFGNNTSVSSDKSNNSRSIGMDYSVVETETEIKEEVKTDKEISTTSKPQTDGVKKEANPTGSAVSSSSGATTASSVEKNTTGKPTNETTVDKNETTSKQEAPKETTKTPAESTSLKANTSASIGNISSASGKISDSKVIVNSTAKPKTDDVKPAEVNKTGGKSDDGSDGLNMHITINDKSGGASYKTVNMSTNALLAEEKSKSGDGGEDYQDGGNILPIQLTEHSVHTEAKPPPSVPKHKILNVNNFKYLGIPDKKEDSGRKGV